MIFICLILFATTVILWITDHKSESTKWAVIFLLCGSIGSLAVTIEQSILPALLRYEISHPLINGFLYRIQIYGIFFNQVCFPYAILMYAIVETNFVGRKMKWLLTIVLLILIFVIISITPTIDNKIRIDYMKKLVWVVPYLLAACFLMLYAYTKESSRLQKRHRLQSAYLIVPTVIGILALNYISKAVKLDLPMYRYLAIFVGFSFALFIVLAFVEGALGVRLRFERQRFDTARRTMTSGASFVNHAIKEEMGKIILISEQLQAIALKNEQRDIRRYAVFIQQSAEHLMSMSARLRNQFRDFELNTDAFTVKTLIEDSLSLVAPLLDKKSICVFRERCPPVRLVCDQVLIHEVLINIWTNAIEAMHEGGQLRIAVYRTKRGLAIETKDNGSGISKEYLGRIMEPFFSTKRGTGNMGLGLSYGFHVMQKHDGRLMIESVDRAGTTVTLLFPKKRVLDMVL